MKTLRRTLWALSALAMVLAQPAYADEAIVHDLTVSLKTKDPDPAGVDEDVTVIFDLNPHKPVPPQGESVDSKWKHQRFYLTTKAAGAGEGDDGVISSVTVGVATVTREQAPKVVGIYTVSWPAANVVQIMQTGHSAPGCGVCTPQDMVRQMGLVAAFAEAGKKLVACRGGIDHDKWVPPQPDDPIVRVDKYTDTKTGEVLKTEEKPVWGACRTELCVLEVELFKDNTTWTEAAKLTSPPVHLFTMEVIAGIQIKGPRSETIKAEIWTSDDAAHKVTITLTENPAGTYRNTGTDTWPHFYREYQVANRRLKVVDESGELHVVPMRGDTRIPRLEVSEKVDAAEVAALDATMSQDAKQFYDDMGSCAAGEPSWISKEHFYYHVEAERPNVTDDNCRLIGKDNDFIYIAGHGLMTLTAVCGDTDTHPLGNCFNPNGDEFTPSDIDTAWGDGECEWVTFAVCSQVRIPNPANPQATDNAIKWIKKMPKVHALIGYSQSAPGIGTDVLIAADFVKYLHGIGGKAHKTVVDAWMQANLDRQATNATALVQKECVTDQCKTLSAFPTAETGEVKYIYYYITQGAVATSEITLP